MGAIRLALTVWPPKYKKKLANKKNNNKKKIKTLKKKDILFVWKGPKGILPVSFLVVSIARMIVSNLRTMLLMKVVFRFSIYFFTKMLILAFFSFLPIKSH